MKPPLSPTITPLAAAMLLALAMVWGGSFFFAKYAVAVVPPLTIAMYRVLWAVPVLMAVLWWKGLCWPQGRRIWGAFLVMGALNNAIPFSLIFWFQSRGPSMARPLFRCRWMSGLC